MPVFGEARAEREPRPPSLLDACAPIAVLVVLLALTVVLFGIDATGGPLQVALMTSGVFAGLVAMKNGYDADRLRDAAIGGVSSAMGAIFILLAVGALIGTWNMAGTIPTVVSYGVAILKPGIFFAAVAVICALVGAVTGSSWTTAGTLGVAFVGMAPVLGLSTSIAAGAVISGAYVGDKMSPLSETTILVPTLVGGVSVTDHIKGMVATVAPAFVVALVIYLGIGLTADVDADPTSVEAARRAIADTFWINPLNLLPIVALVILTIRKVPPYLTIFLVALGTGVLACITQPDVVDAFVGGDAGRLRTSVEAVYSAMGSGFESTSGNATIDGLFSGGGMAGDAADGLADPRRAQLRRHHGGGRVPRPAHRARGPASQLGGRAHPVRRRHLSRPQHRGRRPVRRRGPAQPGLPGGVRAARARPPHAVTHRRGHRDRHVATGAVEQLRRLHDRASSACPRWSTCPTPSSTSSTRWWP